MADIYSSQLKIINGIEDNKWVVDVNLAAPRFFRDRFAVALGKPEKGNWKQMHVEENGNAEHELEAKQTQVVWDN
jgi:hypothetical protein